LPVEMSFTRVQKDKRVHDAGRNVFFIGAQKDKRVHDAGRNVFYRGLKGQKGACGRLKCLLQRFKRTKGCMWPVEMSFTEVQKDKRVHVAG